MSLSIGFCDNVSFATVSIPGTAKEDSANCSFHSREGPQFMNIQSFGIYDGHNGSFASNYCAENLFETVCSKYNEFLNIAGKYSLFDEGQSLQDIEKALKRAKSMNMKEFNELKLEDLLNIDEKLDALFCEALNMSIKEADEFIKSSSDSGTTMSCLFLRSLKEKNSSNNSIKVLYCNVGDSRGILIAPKYDKDKKKYLTKEFSLSQMQYDSEEDEVDEKDQFQNVFNDTSEYFIGNESEKSEAKLNIDKNFSEHMKEIEETNNNIRTRALSFNFNPSNNVQLRPKEGVYFMSEDHNLNSQRELFRIYTKQKLDYCVFPVPLLPDYFQPSIDPNLSSRKHNKSHSKLRKKIFSILRNHPDLINALSEKFARVASLSFKMNANNQADQVEIDFLDPKNSNHTERIFLDLYKSTFSAKSIDFSLEAAEKVQMITHVQSPIQDKFFEQLPKLDNDDSETSSFVVSEEFSDFLLKLAFSNAFVGRMNSLCIQEQEVSSNNGSQSAVSEVSGLSQSFQAIRDSLKRNKEQQQEEEIWIMKDSSIVDGINRVNIKRHEDEVAKYDHAVKDDFDDDEDNSDEEDDGDEYDKEEEDDADDDEEELSQSEKSFVSIVRNDSLISPRIVYHNNARIQGPLAYYGRYYSSILMTRSIGDKKGPRGCLSIPDITSMVIQPNQYARFVIASDGLWDVIQPEEVKQWSKSKQCTEAKCLAVFLGQKARRRRSKQSMRPDDITVTVVDINSHLLNLPSGSALTILDPSQSSAPFPSPAQSPPQSPPSNFLSIQSPASSTGQLPLPSSSSRSLSSSGWLGASTEKDYITAQYGFSKYKYFYEPILRVPSIYSSSLDAEEEEGSLSKNGKIFHYAIQTQDSKNCSLS